MTGLAITGITSSFRAPITTAEVLLGQGASNSPTAEREALYVGVMTSAGTGTANTAYECKSEADAITYFGAGSSVHRAIRTHLQVNKSGAVYGMGIAATSGGSPAASSATFTVVATPTATCDIVLDVCEERITVTATTTSTATTIGDDIEARINALTHLPLTAANVTGTITLTSKVAGTSQNSIYRIRVVSVTPGVGVTCVASAATLASGAEGSTTENANLVAALATITSSRYYYMGELSGVSANVVSALSHVTTKSEPNPGLRSRLFSAGVGSLSAASTIAIAQNSERCHYGLQINSSHDPAMIVGQLIGIHQKKESTEPHFNFDNYTGTDWVLKKAYAESDWPDLDDVDDAVTDGVMIITSNQVRSMLAMSVTTRSKDLTGLLDDFRATETHRISVMDLLADTLVTRDLQQFAGFHLREDTYLADGTLKADQKLPAKTTTPSRYEQGFVRKILREFYDNGYIQLIDDWFDATVVRIDPSNNSRLQVALSGRTVDQKHQVTFRLAETTPN